MFARVMWVLGLSTVTLGAVQACGSDNGGAAKPNEHDASTGGSSGAGGKSSGGKAGMGGGGALGGGGAGGTGMLGCDTSTCDMQLAPIQQALGGLFTLKSCCLSATACGIDTSVFSMFLGAGAMLPPCVDPNMLTGGNVCPPPVEVPDSGVFPAEDGGLPDQLDKTCPHLTAAGYFDLPGCFLPTGTCGGSPDATCRAGVAGASAAGGHGEA